MTDAQITKAIEEALIKFHGDNECWATEVSVSPHCFANKKYLGSNETLWENSRIDFWALKNGQNPIATAYEIKASRADFKRDSKDKQAAALGCSHRFYYIAPKGLLTRTDIPDWAGFKEYDPATAKIKTVRKSPLRENVQPTWQFMAGLIRKSPRVMRDMKLPIQLALNARLN